MWFKTRVGFVSIKEPSEIIVCQYKDASWSIFARMKEGPEMTLSSFFGVRKGTLTNPSSHLVMFSDSPSVRQAIAECMAKIEAAILTNAVICDLSQFGDAQAWGKKWKHIEWLKQST